MRLSDIKGPRTLDVIADITAPIARIAADENAAALFAPQKAPKGVTPTQLFARRAEKAVPALLRDHHADVVAIIAAINGVKPEDYERDMTLASVLRDVTELLTDEAFLGFTAPSAKGEAS